MGRAVSRHRRSGSGWRRASGIRVAQRRRVAYQRSAAGPVHHCGPMPSLTRSDRAALGEQRRGCRSRRARCRRGSRDAVPRCGRCRTGPGPCAVRAPGAARWASWARCRGRDGAAASVPWRAAAPAATSRAGRRAGRCGARSPLVEFTADRRVAPASGQRAQGPLERERRVSIGVRGPAGKRRAVAAPPAAVGAGTTAGGGVHGRRGRRGRYGRRRRGAGERGNGGGRRGGLGSVPGAGPAGDGAGACGCGVGGTSGPPAVPDGGRRLARCAHLPRQPQHLGELGRFRRRAVTGRGEHGGQPGGAGAARPLSALPRAARPFPSRPVASVRPAPSELIVVRAPAQIRHQLLGQVVAGAASRPAAPVR